MHGVSAALRLAALISVHILCVDAYLPVLFMHGFTASHKSALSSSPSRPPPPSLRGRRRVDRACTSRHGSRLPSRQRQCQVVQGIPPPIYPARCSSAGCGVLCTQQRSRISALARLALSDLLDPHELVQSARIRFTIHVVVRTSAHRTCPHPRMHPRVQPRACPCVHS